MLIKILGVCEMTIVDTLDFSNVVDGIRKFVKISGYRVTDIDAKYARDEFDLVDAISAIKYFMKHTNRMIGKNKHPRSPFNHIDDVSKDMEEFLVVGKTKESTALMRKKNLAMYHLVIDPVMSVLNQIGDHRRCIEHVDEVIDHVMHMVMNSGVETTPDDALVARHQVTKMIAEREAAKKAAARKRPRKKVVDDTIQHADGVADGDHVLEALMV